MAPASAVVLNHQSAAVVGREYPALSAPARRYPCVANCSHHIGPRGHKAASPDALMRGEFPAPGLHQTCCAAWCTGTALSRQVRHLQQMLFYLLAEQYRDHHDSVLQ